MPPPLQGAERLTSRELISLLICLNKLAVAHLLLCICQLAASGCHYIKQLQLLFFALLPGSSDSSGVGCAVSSVWRCVCPSYYLLCIDRVVCAGFTRSLDSINDCRVKKGGSLQMLYFSWKWFSNSGAALGISFSSTGVIDESLEVGQCEI